MELDIVSVVEILVAMGLLDFINKSFNHLKQKYASRKGRVRDVFEVYSELNRALESIVRDGDSSLEGAYIIRCANGGGVPTKHSDINFTTVTSFIPSDSSFIDIAKYLTPSHLLYNSLDGLFHTGDIVQLDGVSLGLDSRLYIRPIYDTGNAYYVLVLLSKYKLRPHPSFKGGDPYYDHIEALKNLLKN